MFIVRRRPVDIIASYGAHPRYSADFNQDGITPTASNWHAINRRAQLVRTSERARARLSFDRKSRTLSPDGAPSFGKVTEIDRDTCGCIIISPSAVGSGIKRGENTTEEERLRAHTMGPGAPDCPRPRRPARMTHKVPDRTPDPIIYRCQKAPRPARSPPSV